MTAPLPRPDDVLAYWIGDARDDAEAAGRQNKLWFTKSFETDQHIADHYLPLLSALAEGLAYSWSEQGARSRLAAIIVLDQFSRNIFRGHAMSFRHDPMALGLCKEGLMLGEDAGLSEVERIFFYLPLEHSERLYDQDMSVSLFEKLAGKARPAFQPLCQSTLDYAVRHRDVIKSYGRFPHRNDVLGRASTAEELAYLALPGSGF